MNVLRPKRATEVRDALQKRNSVLARDYHGLSKRFDKVEPYTKAFLPEEDRFQRLNIDAFALELKYREAKNLPPLYGLPVAVKDIFHVKGFPTLAGSQLPSKALFGSEARSVSLLREAGALILGKTVTTEFAYFAPGPTRNPHSPLHTPGGSSSGSAAAVGADLAPLALGTQTIGSVIRPASFCGVVGFKPSFGRISTEGVIPLAPSLDHVGTFTHDVEMARQAAEVLIEDWSKPSLAESKPVLAIPSGVYLRYADAEMLRRFEQALKHLQQAGYWVKRLDPMPDFEAIVERHNLILAAEAAQVHKRWFAKYSDRYHEKTAALIKRGQGIGKEALELAQKEARQFRLRLRTLMDIHGIDLWIAPGAPGAAPKGLDSTGDPVMNLPWTQAGLPCLGLPMGMNEEQLPLGLQIVADFGQDENLLAWGAGIEEVLAVLN